MWKSARRRDLDRIGILVYGPSERRLMAAATREEKVNIFCRLWILKKTLIKSIGTGLSLGPTESEIPEPMLQGERASEFLFPHRPSETRRLLDPGEWRFAAALAFRFP